MKRKLIISTLIAVLFLTSCSAAPTSPSQGLINEVDVSEKVMPTSQETLFEKKENVLGYLTKEFIDPRANLSFEIPTDWIVEVKTGRLYQITAPMTDPLLPGFTILVSHEYNVTDYVPADSMHTLFTDELTVYTYRLGGENCYIGDLPSPDEVTDDPKYALKKDIVSLRTYSDVAFMKSNNSGMYKKTMNMINAYVNWHGSPTLLSGVVSPENQDKGIELLSYLISTMKEARIETDSEKTYQIGNYHFSAYSDFIKEASFLRTSGLTPISGLGIGVFKFNEETDDKNLSSRISRMISETLEISGEFMPHVSLVDDNSYITGWPAKIYEGSSSFITNGDETSYYGKGGNIFFKAYFIERTGENHAIIVTYETDQIELGERLSKMIENTIEYK